MKKGLIIGLLLITMSTFAQEINIPTGSDKWVTQPNLNATNPHQLRAMDVQRNSNLIILMVNERDIRHFNHWRIWHKLKERKKERIVRRWQRRHGENNTKPEFLRRNHR